MSFSGLLKKVCGFLMVGLVAVASAALIAYKSPTAAQQDRRITVDVTQLPLESGTFPVEMRCEEARSSALNKLDGFTCLAINNTKKKITALAVVYSVIIDNAGEAERETNLLTNDFAIHPDVTEAKRQKLFAQGESRRIGPPGPITFDSGVVSGVELHIDYVEFEDKTSAGPNIHGSKTIGLRREGAAKYKAWLVKQYRRGGMDDQALAALLDAPGLPQELNFGSDPDSGEGAKFYRSVMSSVYASRGVAELKRILDK